MTAPPAGRTDPPPGRTEDSEGRSEDRLRQQLGLFDATMIVCGSVIGIGIFTTTGLVAAELPHPGLLLLAWAVGGVISLAGALALPVVVLAIHALFRRRSIWLRLPIAPLAGGFAGGYFQALKLQGQTCPELKGLPCILQSPDLPNIILGAMVCVVAVYLAFPGKKIPPVGLQGDGGLLDADET